MTNSMKYRFQVLLETRVNGVPVKEWKDVHPTGGQPYEYDTRREAEDMARMCYGNDPSIVRVREVQS
jgi:hypothetical protein